MEALSVLERADDHKIVAHFEANPDAHIPTLDELRELMVSCGLDECHIDEAALTEFLRQCQAAMPATGHAPSVDDVNQEVADSGTPEPESQPHLTIDLCIGERIDAHAKIDVAEDAMRATLTLFSPEGGKPLSPLELNAQVRDAGVIHGVNVDMLIDCLHRGSCEAVCIAEGDPPTAGSPAQFECLFDHARRLEPDDHQKIDYREFGGLVLVTPDLPLVRRIPAVQGMPGKNVRGETVAPVPVADPPFSTDLKGVRFDSSAPDLLFSASSGQPKMVSCGAIVNPVVDVSDVNLATGNVSFDGTLHVTGDIHAGMSVKVGCDVIVEGTIEAAHVQAGGDVHCKGGIVGRADGAGGKRETATVVCGGSFNGRFAEYARIEAGCDIFIQASAQQSDLFAANMIGVGKPGSSQGQIAGGHARALMAVRAAILGSGAGIPTVVQVGLDPKLTKRAADLEHDRKFKLDELNKVKQLLAFFMAHPERGAGGVKEKVELKQEDILKEIEAINGRMREIFDQLQVAAQAVIEVGRTIYSGVNLQIGSKLIRIHEDMSGGTLALVEGEIKKV